MADFSRKMVSSLKSTKSTIGSYALGVVLLWATAGTARVARISTPECFDPQKIERAKPIGQAKYDRGRFYVLFGPHATREDFQTLSGKLNDILSRSAPDAARQGYPQLFVIHEPFLPWQDVIGELPPPLQSLVRTEEDLVVKISKEDLNAAYERVLHRFRQAQERVDHGTKERRVAALEHLFRAPKHKAVSPFMRELLLWNARAGVRQRILELDFQPWYRFLKDIHLNKSGDLLVAGEVEGFFHAYRQEMKALTETTVARDKAARKQAEELLKTHPGANVVFVVGGAHVMDKDLLVGGLRGGYFIPSGLDASDLRLVGYAGGLMRRYKDGSSLSREEERDWLAKAFLEGMLGILLPPEWSLGRLIAQVRDVFEAAGRQGLRPWQALVKVGDQIRRGDVRSLPAHDRGLERRLVQALKELGWLEDRAYRQLISSAHSDRREH